MQNADASRILVVDDEPQIRLMVRTMLSKNGFRCAEAIDGRHALDLIESCGGAFDLVISDYSMPRMDGGTLVRHLRPRFPSIQVLVLSTEAEASSIPETIFLAKPFVPSQLIAEVRRLLKKETPRCA
jgi:CheY-like chemotaxis protein